MFYSSYIPLSEYTSHPEPIIEYNKLANLVISYIFKHKINLSRSEFECSVVEISMDLCYSGLDITFDELTIKKNGHILINGDKLKNYRLYGEPPKLNGRTFEDVILPLSMMDLDKILSNGDVINIEYFIKNNNHRYFKLQPYTKFLLEYMAKKSMYRIELDRDEFNDYVHILKDGINL